MNEPEMMRLRRVAALISEQARVRDVPKAGMLLGIGDDPSEAQMFDALSSLWADDKKLVIVVEGKVRSPEIQPMAK